MPRIPIFRLGGTPEKPTLPKLASSTPFISLKGLAVGVDNLRHDVVLSPRFAEASRAQIARLIARHGELEGLLAAEAPARDAGAVVDEKPGGGSAGLRASLRSGSRCWRSCMWPR